MIIVNPIIVALNLAVAAINIIEFFLLVRLILSWKKIVWLRPLDTAGSALVSKITALTEKLFGKISHQHLTARSNIALSLFILELIKIMLCVI